MADRIDHVAEALSLLATPAALAESIRGREASEEWVDDLRDAAARSIATAQVHATLALVEQQRIANLIALGAIGGGPINNSATGHVQQHLRREWPDVARALGIGGWR